MCSSDLCRTVPVNGHFTPEQRRLYEIVLFPRTISIEPELGRLTSQALPSRRRRVRDTSVRRRPTHPSTPPALLDPSRSPPQQDPPNTLRGS